MGQLERQSGTSGSSTPHTVPDAAASTVAAQEDTAEVAGSEASEFTDDSVSEDYESLGEGSSDSEDEEWSGGDSAEEDNSGSGGEEATAAEVDALLAAMREADLRRQRDDEYEFDSSDEEDVRNTLGNVPLEWYRDHAHIGYDWSGRAIVKPQQADALDNLVSRAHDPDFGRRVTDPQTGGEILLSHADIDIIKRLRGGKTPVPGEEYPEWEDLYSHEVMQHPVVDIPPHKRSFVPSNWERLKVGKMVHALKMGWMKPQSEVAAEAEQDRKFYALWRDEDEAPHKFRTPRIQAPKLALPDHSESYNPPPEYLLTPEEEEKWRQMEPADRRTNFIPQKFDSLRKVPAYNRFINERFERCLDLYLCPRKIKMKFDVRPEELVPKLPKARELEPYPKQQAVVYRGHRGAVLSVAVDPTGQWLATGSADSSLRVWEIVTGRCLLRLPLPDKVRAVAWNPNSQIQLIAVAAGNVVYFIAPDVGDKLVVSSTRSLFSSLAAGSSEPSAVTVDWQALTGKKKAKSDKISEEEEDSEVRLLSVTQSLEVKRLAWHPKGDYLAATMRGSSAQSVLIHQLSKSRSQSPFSKAKGEIEQVIFHPTRPYIIIAAERFVRIYNLVQQALVKKLSANVQAISCVAVHPKGDNIIVGSYEARLNWFDLDLSTRPYKNIRPHKDGLRQVAFHRRYPLFASCSDDGNCFVAHGQVYTDLMQNPLVVPLKMLKGHVKKDDLGVIDCIWHPTQPWLFSGGADGTARLWSN